MTNILTNDELLTHITDQKELETFLGLSRSQAWRVINGKSKLSGHAIELVMIKLGIHTEYKPIQQ
ncbi:MAG TPA: hypothetical protein EYN54_13775 [Methylococcaceae bacterium]|nr:hypothetical protein [Methylococcaceae bacterium]